jgi:hypothetical protein
MSKLKVWSHNKFGAVIKELDKIRKQMHEQELQHTHTNHAELMPLSVGVFCTGKNRVVKIARFSFEIVL